MTSRLNHRFAPRRLLLVALTATLIAPLTPSGAAFADHTPSQTHDHDSHDHSAHDHSQDDAATQIYKGYFDDAAIQDRTLQDWAGTWQSVYPYLIDGTLAPVMEKKAATGEKTVAEYTSYYDTGYKTPVETITINGNEVSFVEGGNRVTATYTSDGYEVLTYAKGNRGVRYIFAKTDGSEVAPQFIQFSDHRITPSKSDHYHLYWGNDRAALLKEVTNWPTYYPASLTGDEIVDEMLAH
jgi:zinc transport system substrate-binding protein